MDVNKEVINAIGDLKEDMVMLKEKYENLSNYIFRDLKPDIEKLCDKVENSMIKNEEGYHKNLRWMIATLIAFIAAVFGWIGLLVRVVI